MTVQPQDIAPEIALALKSPDPIGTAYALDPAELALPKDAGSTEFVDRLQVLRKNFTTRTNFNFMVCDELARRGVQPNSNTVLAAGHWGSSNAVASDVREWFASLARRLERQHANIPDAVRQAANDLFEHMWRLAAQKVAEPMGNQIDSLQARLDDASAAVRDAAEVSHAANERADSLATKLDDARGRAEQLQQEIERQRRAHQEASDAWLQEGRELAEGHLVEMRAAAKALADSQADAVRRFDDAQARANEALQRQIGDLQRSRNEQERMAEEMAALRRESSMQIDRARQDIKEANARADAAEFRASQARAAEAQLRDQLASTAIESARREMTAEGLGGQIAALQEQLASLKAEMAAVPDAPRAKTSPPRKRKG